MSSHILVVDNEPYIRRLVGNSLTRAGYLVDAAISVRDGLDCVRRHVPELVITDYSMPGPDGLDLCRALRAEEETSETPIIMVTGYSHDLTDGDLRSEFGVTCVFEKPFSPTELVDTVRMVIDGEWPGVPAPHNRRLQ